MRSAQPNNQRAMTDEQKEEVIARVLAAWKKNHKLRLGQLVWISTGGSEDFLFSIEDTVLAAHLELDHGQSA